jgi:hypothetical protein
MVTKSHKKNCFADVGSSITNYQLLELWRRKHYRERMITLYPNIKKKNIIHKHIVIWNIITSLAQIN